MAGGEVVVLAGGTGGAKLARGMLDVVGDELVVVANTADDVEVYGAHVSPDPDLVLYWLADRIDGLRGVDAGRLEMARIAESLTALLISINARNKVHAGIRITGL